MHISPIFSLSPAIVSAKINFLSRSPHRECSFECELWNREALAFVKSQREQKQIMQTTLNRCCQSQRRVFRVSINVKINKRNAEASHTTWIRNEKEHFWLCFISIGTWSFHEFLIQKFSSLNGPSNGYTSVSINWDGFCYFPKRTESSTLLFSESQRRGISSRAKNIWKFNWKIIFSSTITILWVLEELGFPLPGISRILPSNNLF